MKVDDGGSVECEAKKMKISASGKSKAYQVCFVHGALTFEISSDFIYM